MKLRSVHPNVARKLLRRMQSQESLGGIGLACERDCGLLPAPSETISTTFSFGVRTGTSIQLRVAEPARNYR